MQPSFSSPSDSGNPLWMTLEELSGAPDFQARLVDEFPQGAAVWGEGLSRRRFLQLMGASIALAGLNGCMRLPEQKIIPYTEQPEKLVPGRPLHYATTLRINGHPRGVIVTQNEGRPTHIAGNPLHPLSLGATDVWTTASLLDLYDPDRLQSVLHQGSATSWEAFEQVFLSLQRELRTTGGAGFCLVTPPLHSPTELRLIAHILAALPQARWYVHDPIDSATALENRFDLANADIIFALESDFLYDRPDSLALIRAFSKRRATDDGRSWNRLYVAESCPTITGAKADHRFAVPPQEFDELAAALLASLQGTAFKDARWPWLEALTNDLRQHAGRSLFIAGRSASDYVRQAFSSANTLLGNSTLLPPAPSADVQPHGTLADLVPRLQRREVSTLVMLGVNPVFDAPSDFSFAELLAQVPASVCHSFYENETSRKCSWTIHAAHDLEAWGDTKSSDGTLSIAQPLIAPLYDGKSTIEMLSLIGEEVPRQGYDLVRETWQQTLPDPSSFEAEWHHWLRDGVIRLPGSATFASPPPLPPASSSASTASTNSLQSLWLCFRPSAALWDGRHANNGWLQELPDPITKLTWDNAALFSPGSAGLLKVTDGDVVTLHVNGTRIDAPILIVPGHADHCITLPLGYGCAVSGQIGINVGVDAYPLRRSDALWHIPIDDVERKGTQHPFAKTQEHFRVEGRDLLHVARVDDKPATPAPPTPEQPLPSLYPEVKYEGHKWALSIDLNSCVGCNACIIACQSENNIPVVGKEQVLFGREMQWIRVDRYFQGDVDTPRAHFQPVTCMQCEDAPCEVVCPVAATQHDDEGLNTMVYNRCVGTRYCSNNCPYKVRRFNFLFYNAAIPESQRLRLNPNVTIRSRGVMEKCTYCVQRIEEARIGALREHRPLRGSDITTACQAACPAEAIVFGDLSDPDSTVSRNRKKPGHYAMLEELNTKPRTTYLKKRINPNPALEPASAARPPST